MQASKRLIISFTVCNRNDTFLWLCACELCQSHNHDLRLKDRSWTCKECGKLHDRDVLAANNIKAFAFDRQSLIENLGNNRVGRTRINAQGEDKVAALCGSGLQ